MTDDNSDSMPSVWNPETEAFFRKTHAENIEILSKSPEEADRAYGEWMASSAGNEEQVVKALLSRSHTPKHLVALLTRQFVTNVRFICGNITNGDSLRVRAAIAALTMLGGDEVKVVNVGMADDDDKPGVFKFPPTNGPAN